MIFYLENIMQFSEFLQRAAAIQQQVDIDRNMNNQRFPGRVGNPRPSIFDRPRNQLNLGEDESSR